MVGEVTAYEKPVSTAYGEVKGSKAGFAELTLNRLATRGVIHRGEPLGGEGRVPYRPQVMQPNAQTTEDTLQPYGEGHTSMFGPPSRRR
jgi:hypothetical protein